MPSSACRSGATLAARAAASTPGGEARVAAQGHVDGLAVRREVNPARPFADGEGRDDLLGLHVDHADLVRNLVRDVEIQWVSSGAKGRGARRQTSEKQRSEGKKLHRFSSGKESRRDEELPQPLGQRQLFAFRYGMEGVFRRSMAPKSQRTTCIPCSRRLR